jgi:hypothetical protein
MRKLVLAATLAALGAALLATSASAIDHHFVVRMKYVSSHTIGHRAFVRKDKLVDFHNRQDRVGRDRWRCRVVKGHTGHLKCKAFIHLNGKIGGRGAIRVRGDIQHKDDHLVVTGGSRQFDGVAGKVTWKGVRLYFDLVR